MTWDGEPTAPPTVPGADGKRYVDPASGSEGRNYTVRRHLPHPDGDRIDIDVILHGRGSGTTWASATAPGDRIGLDHARSWYRPEPATEWQLLVADLSGLPATARIIEELPGGVPVTVIVEVADADDLDYLPSHPDVTVVSSIGTGNGHAPSRLAQLTRDQRLPDGRGYCWFAGEAAESRTVPKVLPRQRVDGRPVGHHRLLAVRLREVGRRVRPRRRRGASPVWERALADGKGEKVADEEFDEALERAGL